MGTVHIRLDNDLGEITRLAAWIHEFGTANSLADINIGEINLALEELVSNIILHGYGEGANKGIDVTLELRDSTIYITVKDDASPFNPLNIDDPDVNAPFAEREVGGLGIFLTKQVMDTLAYEVHDGKNVLLLEKRITE